MNRNALLLTTALIGLIFLLGGAMPEPRNPPTANTGAPGETSCMLSNCHVGGSFTGTVSLSGLPDTVLADQSYEITLFNRSNAVRSGFQMTVLDATNNFTGAFTGNTEVNVARDNGNGRTYARHALAKFLVNGEASWKFNWKAPTSVLNDSMVFYFSSMCANGNGNRTGDNSIKSTKRVIFKLPSASDDLVAETQKISAYYSKGAIQLAGGESSAMKPLSLHDIRGAEIPFQFIAATTRLELPIVSPGIYLLQMEYKGHRLSRKIYIAG